MVVDFFFFLSITFNIQNGWFDPNLCPLLGTWSCKNCRLLQNLQKVT
jgi:hypothetical protein